MGLFLTVSAPTSCTDYCWIWNIVLETSGMTKYDCYGLQDHMG